MSTTPARACGIDFGTSNSTVGWLRPGVETLIALEDDKITLPSVVFFNMEERRPVYGRLALHEYLEGYEGRLMRSLKSLLGSALLREQTVVHGKPQSYQDIVSGFLQELVRRAQVQLGGLPARLVLGRPVHFVDDDPARDAQAQESLRLAASACGFAEIGFQLEPIAAALDYERRLDEERTVLVVDIGGGTSDFTVVRLGPQRIAQVDRSSDILATAGIHIGGTDYDRQLNLARVMPLLGLRHIGPQGREVPSRVFFDLATWHLIHWRYSAKAMRDAQSDEQEQSAHRTGQTRRCAIAGH